ncbi:MAG: type II toxin-antitoxin system RelE/ParE family toxin [Allosphingosinicella sp.]
MWLEFKSEAEEDLVRIFEFNIQRSERWAQRVEDRLLDRCEALLRTPHIGRLGEGSGRRQLSVPDIQYVIDYQPFDDRVTIVRIRHTREIR